VDVEKKILALELEVEQLRLMVNELWLCHQAAFSSGESDCAFLN